jgi:hypothetical protein
MIDFFPVSTCAAASAAARVIWNYDGTAKHFDSTDIAASSSARVGGVCARMCFVRASESDSNDVLLERLTARVSRGESE